MIGTEDAGRLPGLQIELEEVVTSIVARTVVTDGNCNYEALDFKGGDYRPTAPRAGFKSFVATDNNLPSNQTKRIEVTRK